MKNKLSLEEKCCDKCYRYDHISDNDFCCNKDCICHIAARKENKVTHQHNKAEDKIEIAINMVFHEVCSWYNDEGDYQPTFEQAKEKSIEIIKDLLLQDRKERGEELGCLHLAHEELLELRGYLMGTGNGRPNINMVEKYMNSPKPEWEKRLSALSNPSKQ